MNAIFVIGLIAVVGAFWLYSAKTQHHPLQPNRHDDRVAYVYDGDTVKLEGSKTRIRLWGIDAPEKGEEGAEKAKDALTKMVSNKRISYQQMDTDRYGRIVARVFLKDGREVNRIMIEKGLADEYCRYSKGFYGTC